MSILTNCCQCPVNMEVCRGGRMMKFGELKSIINRHKGRHDLVAIHIGLGCDGIIEAESPIIDMLDGYDVDWIAPGKVGSYYLADCDLPCIEVHLKAMEEE